MNILHIATKDTGGAGIAATRIHFALNALPNGVNSKMLLLWKAKEYAVQDNVIKYATTKGFRGKAPYYLTWLNRKIYPKFKFRKSEINSFYYYSAFCTEKHELIEWADLIHLHWTNGFVNPKRFFKKVKKPVIWTFHDMTPFSGGNPYESGIFKNNLIAFNDFLKKKKELLINHGKVYGHATSPTFRNKAVKDYKTFPMKEVFVIPYPLHPDTYGLTSKGDARKKLSIPNQKKVILFVAADVKNDRKGVKFLLTDCIIKKYQLVMVGAKNPELNKYKEIIQLGNLTAEELNTAYSSADLYVTPSIEEAFGQTIIEALYCGIPVVAFKTAGANYIVNKKNGILAKEITTNSLLEAIEEALTTKFSAHRISFEAKERFNPEVIGEKFLRVYNNILSRNV